MASKNGWVYMRVQGGFNLHRLFCLRVVCVSQNGGLFGEFFIYINDFDLFKDKVKVYPFQKAEAANRNT